MSSNSSSMYSISLRMSVFVAIRTMFLFTTIIYIIIRKNIKRARTERTRGLKGLEDED